MTFLQLYLQARSTLNMPRLHRCKKKNPEIQQHLEDSVYSSMSFCESEFTSSASMKRKNSTCKRESYQWGGKKGGVGGKKRTLSESHLRFSRCYSLCKGMELDEVVIYNG